MDELKASTCSSGEVGAGRESLLKSLLSRELGSKTGQEQRDLIAECRFVDKQDMEATPCKCFSGSTRSAFITVFSSDASIMASTHGDHNLYVTRIKDGVCVRTLKGHPRTPWSAAFHPGIPGILASGCLGGHVRVWDYRQGGSEYWNTNCVITSVTFHPTERILLIATLNKLYLWDWLQAAPFTSLSTQSEKEKIIFVKFDALGHHLITGITNLKSTPSGANSTNNGNSENPFRVYSTASNNENMSEFEEASWYYRLMMPPNSENDSGASRRRFMRPGFYSQMRRRLSASQTLSDLAAAASSQLEAENAAAAAENASNALEEEEQQEEPPGRLQGVVRTPRRSRYSRYPPDHAYIRDRRSPFTHSPESSFVEVPSGEGPRPSSSFMEVLYSNPDRSSRFHQRRARRLRERLSRRQSLYSRMDDIRSGGSDQGFGYRRIDEWAVNRRMSLARSSSLLNAEDSFSEALDSSSTLPPPPSEDPDNALHLSIRSQVDLSVLGRHIEHMQRICQTSLRYLNVSRQRRQILRLQTIRMMLEDLQNQIRNLRESTLERSAESSPSSSTAAAGSSSSSNNALAMSITRRLHLTREGLNRAMRRLNRATSSSLSSRRPSSGSSGSARYTCMSRLILSRLRATVRAMEMSPDLSRSAHNNPVNELLAEESLAVMERTESDSNGEGGNSGRNALRAMSQRLERIIRENREASGSAFGVEEENGGVRGEEPLLEEEEGPGRHNWSHLLDHGGYARQPRETSSDSDGESDLLLQRGGGDQRRRWRLDQNSEDGGVGNEEDPLDLLSWMPSSSRFHRSVIRNMRELGRASMRERLDSRAELRRDWERARQRFSRARMIFNQRRERELGEPSSASGPSSGGGSPSQGGSSPQVDNWVLRYLLRRNMQLNALEDEIGDPSVPSGSGEPGAGRPQQGQSSSQRPLHREILSWMVDQLTIDQQNNGGGDSAVLPPPVPEPIYRRRRTAFYFRHNAAAGGESGEAPRDNYFQQLRNHKYSSTHRLQIWDFHSSRSSSSSDLPDIGDRSKNVIVEKAKIYNDASVDISLDGTILVTFVSSSLPLSPIVGIYGCCPNNIGTCLATYSLEAQAVSVSLSPTSRHLLVGVSSKASDRLDIDRSLMAQVFKVQFPWDRKADRGRLIHHRDIHHSPEHGYIGLNSIRWIPNPGQGIVYATNTGLLQILR